MSVPDSEDHAEAIREVANCVSETQGCNPTSEGTLHS
jgi:predicted dinucleotide-binding enzyme